MEAAKEGSSSRSYYDILGVSSDSSIEEMRRAYRKLAMQWHPDRWTRKPSLLGEAKRRFQQIQEAYSVLSDHKKRTIYDAGLYDPEDEEDEEFSDFVEEMVSLMSQEKDYSMEELQTMFTEMAKEFQSPSSWYYGPSSLDESQCSKRKGLETERLNDGGSQFFVPGFKIYKKSS